MNSDSRRVVVTGLGVVSSIGIGSQAYWEALLAGKSGISNVDYFNPEAFTTEFGGEIKDFDPLQFMSAEEARRYGRGTQFAVAAGRMALEEAGETSASKSVGVCMGTTMADIRSLESCSEEWVKSGPETINARILQQYPSSQMAAKVARQFGLRGPNLMIPTACAAGNYAIGYASDLIKMGKAEAMLAGGADPFSRIAFTGFSRLLALSPDKCRPFDKNRKGTLVGEGAGVVYLETLESARNRGANILAEVLGYGLSCDGRHMTIPNSDGVAKVMLRALSESGVSADEVDYISAHGTGTPANDKSESAAINTVFGGRKVKVSSIKSMLGHTMGAASALEFISCVLALNSGKIPPTINFSEADEECVVDCVPNSPEAVAANCVVNNSFAFGGNNASLLLNLGQNV